MQARPARHLHAHAVASLVVLLRGGCQTLAASMDEPVLVQIWHSVDDHDRGTGNPRLQVWRGMAPLNGQKPALLPDRHAQPFTGYTSANRRATRWDVALFFSALAVPFAVGLVFEMRTRYASGRSDRYYTDFGYQRGGTADSCGLLGALRGDEPPEGTVPNNLLSGVAAAVSCLPQAIASSILAGVPPINGIWAGVLMGLSTALVGGRPGMISCASASTAVIIAEVARDPELGLGGMAVVVVLCGALQGTVGALRLARFASLVPHTVMLGFVNGLAIVVAIEQVNQFREVGPRAQFLEGAVLHGMVLTAAVSFASAALFPFLPVLGKLLPAPFIAIVGSVVFGHFMRSRWPQRTLGDVAGMQAFAGGLEMLPPYNFPPLEVAWGTRHLWAKAILASVRMAIVGLVESLLTMMLVDSVTDTRGHITRECFGQALGNLLCGVFGLQGGCALFCQTMLDVWAGGRGRLAGLTTAAGLFTSVVFLAPLVAKIPVASVIGLMCLVSIKTFTWGMLGLFRQASIQYSDGVVVLLVTLVGIFWDLAVAVILGLVVSVIMFAWTVSNSVRLEISVDPFLQKRNFSLHGPLFFASSSNFEQLIDAEKIREAKVALDFTHGSVLDFTGLDAVTKVIGRLKDRHKRIEITGLNPTDQEYVFAETGVAAL